MATKNKDRVFVALNYRRGITGEPNSFRLGHARFHWAIWTEPKGSKWEGACYQVVNNEDEEKGEDASASTLPGSIASTLPGSVGSSRFDWRAASNLRSSRSLVGRIMVGKLPPELDPEQLADILGEVKLPPRDDDTDPLQDSVVWVRKALQTLQNHGAVEKFDVDVFMDHALQQVSEFYDSGFYPQDMLLDNYTNRSLR